MNINVEHSISQNTLIIDKGFIDYYNDFFGVTAFISFAFVVVFVIISFLTNVSIGFYNYILIYIVSIPLSIKITGKFVTRSERIFKIAENINEDRLVDVLNRFLEEENFDIRYQDGIVYIISEDRKFWNMPLELLFILHEGNVYLNIRNRTDGRGRNPFISKNEVNNYTLLFMKSLS